ncbi:unnamed protein product [Rhizoctonia solani]|uniref:C2H2-type domain-containing protein n=1 Tax=Rhizoctonia solani TaxID=456999 RepID=A0A8H3ADN9_9AGAM|nr:unnamed protein product [Rhizoctonia solani]
MSYPNNHRRQIPGGGSNEQQRLSHVNMPYAPLSQPQNNNYLSCYSSNPISTHGYYPDASTVPWPYATPEYGWAGEVPVVPSGGYSAVEYPPYPVSGTIASHHAPSLHSGPYTEQYTGTHELPGWPSIFSSRYNPVPSPPPEALNPQELLKQSPTVQSTGSGTRRRRSPPTSQASSSGATLGSPSYQIVYEDGREVYVCRCGCERRYGRYNEWMRAHENTAVCCPLCQREMSRPDALLRHLKKQHNVYPAH